MGSPRLTLARRGACAPAQNYVSDTFNRNDSSSTAGSTDSFAGGTTQSWSPSAGSTWGITGKNLYGVSGTSYDIILVPATVYADVRATIVALQTHSGSVVGVVAGAADVNNFVVVQVGTTGNMGVYKRVSGTFTQLGSLFPNGTFQGGELGLRLRPGSGSNTLIDIFNNGILLASLNVALGFSLGANVGIAQDINASSPARVRDFRAANAARSLHGPPVMARTGIVFSATGSEGEVLNPDVKWINGRWVMNYSPDYPPAGDQGLATSLAYASSLYGPWVREVNNPVLVPGSGEGTYATNGSMVFFGGQYIIYYQGGSGDIRYATASAVGGPYTKGGVLFTDRFDPMARVVGSTVELWMGTPVTPSAGVNRTCCYATSSDGTSFSASTNAFICPPVGNVIASQVEPAVYTDADGGYHVFYNSASNITGVYPTHEAYSSTGIGGPWTFRPCRLLPSGSTGDWDGLAQYAPFPILANAEGTGPGNELFILYNGAVIISGSTGAGASIGIALGPIW